jgi:hypothetical protein
MQRRVCNRPGFPSFIKAETAEPPLASVAVVGGRVSYPDFILVHNSRRLFGYLCNCWELSGLLGLPHWQALGVEVTVELPSAL